MSDLNNLVDPQMAQLRELMSQSKFEEALPVIETILRKSPTDPQALRGRLA